MMVDPHPPGAPVTRTPTDRMLSLVTTLVVIGAVNAFLMLVLVWRIWAVIG